MSLNCSVQIYLMILDDYQENIFFFGKIRYGIFFYFKRFTMKIPKFERFYLFFC
jgi:hypothetical protein